MGAGKRQETGSQITGLYLCDMKKMIHNDRICGGVAAQEYVETLANEMDNALAQGEFYEIGIDEIQVWFDFILVGEPECPDMIRIEANGFLLNRYEVINDEGLTIWGICQKAAEFFLNLLLNEYNYNPVSR